mmetsp:Transcript_11976/g.30799  ORF Transcript_11976/g.30799 Transcript_11976/m.30799 type:complete len:257 (+) Transcript_11976:137-907(+)
MSIRRQGGGGGPGGRQLSTGTEALLKSMMKKSGISASQQRRLSATISTGAALPRRCHPTSSAPDKDVAAAPRGSTAGLSSGRVDPRTYSGGKRSAKNIRKNERPRFIPSGPVVSRDALKEAYSEKLAYGDSGAAHRQTLRAMAKKGALRPRPRRVPKDDGDEVDAATPRAEHARGQREFTEVMAEVTERKRHLETMRGLGVWSPAAEATLSREISQRVRRLEKIDREQKARLASLESLGGAGTSTNATTAKAVAAS